MNKAFNSMAYAKNFKVSPIDTIKLQRILELMGSNKMVLDLGCGDGVFMDYIQKIGNKVVGVDISDSAIKKARKKGYKIYDLPLDQKFASKITERFDVVLGSEIIEHIFDTDLFLQQIKKVLKKNGSLILTTPNIASLGRRMLLLFGKSPLTEYTARKTDAGHIRYFTPQTLTQLLQENGYTVTHCSSAVVNLDITGKIYSKWLADMFPTFGNTIIVKAVKD